MSNDVRYKVSTPPCARHGCSSSPVGCCGVFRLVWCVPACCGRGCGKSNALDSWHPNPGGGGFDRNICRNRSPSTVDTSGAVCHRGSCAQPSLSWRLQENHALGNGKWLDLSLSVLSNCRILREARGQGGIFRTNGGVAVLYM